MTVKINNLPANVERYGWLVCVAVDGEIWFYGAWAADEEAEAQARARQLANGLVVKVGA